MNEQSYEIIVGSPRGISLPSEVTKNYRVYREEVSTDFEGTIVDIETIGDFIQVGTRFPPQEQDYLGKYRDMKITTVGVLSENELAIFIAKNIECVIEFQKSAIKLMSEVSSPTYAFNKSFEEGCYFWNSGFNIIRIDNELQTFAGEKKEDVVEEYGISKYNDPFHGDGGKYVAAFFEGNIDDIIKHNRACLLKEHQILKERGAKRIRTEWLNY